MNRLQLPANRIGLCVSFCEAAPPTATAGELEALLAATCHEAGFPYCERIYIGSYFCDEYFCRLPDAFHESVRELCIRHDLAATLVVPIIGQSLLEQASGRIDDLLGTYADVYDEVVANDVALFRDLAVRTDKQLGLGRLFSKEPRDARIPSMMDRAATPALSAEALECLAIASCQRAGSDGSRPMDDGADEATCERVPVVELDPVANVVDVSRILEMAPDTEIALHLPLCYATTGRTCSAASVNRPVSMKFRVGRTCSQQCLRMVQHSTTDEGVRYVKHGRTHYFSNPGCSIAGTSAWRLVYACAHETMR